MNAGDEVGRLREMAVAYHKLLTAIDWSNEVLLAGIGEGLNKFLSNAYLKHCCKGINKYRTTHYASRAALAKMEQNDYTGLVFEHLVPKDGYQKECENRAAAGDLTVEFIEDLLTKYWLVATITREEDSRLPKMPTDWDREDCLARYKAVGIELVPARRAGIVP
jgi:hypothetical protein